MEQRPGNRLDGIQALRGVAALGVAFFHFAAIEDSNGPDRVTSLAFTYGQAGVDLFFVISGFIMVYVTQNMAPGPESARTFLTKRLLRIYPPYWVVTTLVILIWLGSGGNAMDGLVGANPNFASSFTLWPETQQPILNIGWTLTHEIYFYLCFTLALFAPRKIRLFILVLWGVLMAAMYIAGARGSPLTALLSHPLNFEFLLGAGIAWLRPRLGSKANWAALALAFGFALGVVHEWGWTPTAVEYRNDLMRACLMGPLAACLVFICADESLKWPSQLKNLGDWSYALYLVHIPVFAALGFFWQRVSRAGVADNLIAMAIMVGAAILCAQLFYNWVERPLLAFRPQLRPAKLTLEK